MITYHMHKTENVYNRRKSLPLCPPFPTPPPPPRHSIHFVLLPSIVTFVRLSISSARTLSCACMKDKTKVEKKLYYKQRHHQLDSILHPLKNISEVLLGLLTRYTSITLTKLKLSLPKRNNELNTY